MISRARRREGAGRGRGPRASFRGHERLPQNIFSRRRAIGARGHQRRERARRIETRQIPARIAFDETKASIEEIPRTKRAKLASGARSRSGRRDTFRGSFSWVNFRTHLTVLAARTRLPARTGRAVMAAVAADMLFCSEWVRGRFAVCQRLARLVRIGSAKS